jgi:3-hydroxyacyl-CoA dehydrogenase/3a,7a,12a-trihydroxy-5b-cholest-24-enoyl-CoA hydratase
VDHTTGAGAVEPTSADKAADCTLILSDGDFVQLMSGKLNAQQAFMKGQLKIKGNMMAAQKLSAIVGQNSKM